MEEFELQNPSSKMFLRNVSFVAKITKQLKENLVAKVRDVQE